MLYANLIYQFDVYVLLNMQVHTKYLASQNMDLLIHIECILPIYLSSEVHMPAIGKNIVR